MRELNIDCRVYDHRIGQNDRNRIRDFLCSVEDGENILISIKSKRTKNQNAYYWGVVLPQLHRHMIDCGQVHPINEWHEYLKVHVGGLQDIKCINGEYITIMKSTAKLSKQEFIRYLEAVIAWCADQGIHIPQPDNGLLDHWDHWETGKHLKNT